MCIELFDQSRLKLTNVYHEKLILLNVSDIHNTEKLLLKICEMIKKRLASEN